MYKLIDIILHVDKYLSSILEDFGLWTYLILFIIIFCETGLVVTPFLPGDSLIFAIGAMCALGALDPLLTSVILITAAIMGNTVNYWVGAWMGPRVFNEKIRFLRKDYLDKTHAFYEKYGGKTIIFTRFIPIIRTFAPFVAGIGKMTFTRFQIYNIVGAVSWVVLFIYAGFYFGNLPLIKKNFSLVIMAIIVISFIPTVIEFLKHRRSMTQTCA